METESGPLSLPLRAWSRSAGWWGWTSSRLSRQDIEARQVFNHRFFDAATGSRFSSGFQQSRLQRILPQSLVLPSRHHHIAKIVTHTDADLPFLF